MDPRRQIGRRNTEDWRNIRGRAAAEAVAAARKSVVMTIVKAYGARAIIGIKANSISMRAEMSNDTIPETKTRPHHGVLQVRTRSHNSAAARIYYITVK